MVTAKREGKGRIPIKGDVDSVGMATNRFQALDGLVEGANIGKVEEDGSPCNEPREPHKSRPWTLINGLFPLTTKCG